MQMFGCEYSEKCKHLGVCTKTGSFKKTVLIVDISSGFYFCPRRPEECDLGATVDSWLQVPQGLVVQLDSK